MSFDRVNFSSRYSTEASSLIDDFYIPSLRAAVKYDRAVGYFNAGMVSYALQGLAGVVDNDGVMRLIIGDYLKEEEYDAIKDGTPDDSYRNRLQERLRTLLQEEHDELFKFRLDILSWMIRANALEIRIALRLDGIYHEKIGVLTDELDSQIVFQVTLILLLI